MQTDYMFCICTHGHFLRKDVKFYRRRNFIELMWVKSQNKFLLINLDNTFVLTVSSVQKLQWLMGRKVSLRVYDLSLTETDR